ncbi:MAG: dipeptidase [Porticoccaceae bacterium]|jgi:membrane dipeptidase
MTLSSLKNTFTLGLSGLVLTAALSSTGLATAALAQDTDAAAIHKRVLALDGHADVLLPSTPARYWLNGNASRVDLPHLTDGGIDAIVLSVAVGPGPRDAAGVAAARADADAKLAKIKAFIAANPDRVALALSADDVERLHGEGKVAVLIGFQNARIIGKDVSQLDAFYRDGARVFGLNHAGHNDFSDSSRPWGEPVREHGGLSELGRQSVARLNDLGALIDVSQLSTDALLQTLELTRAPVAATHSNVRALVDNTRNLSDAELDAIKANGGVVQVTPFNGYLKVPGAEAHQQIGAVRKRHGLGGDFKTGYEDYNSLPEAKQQPFLDELSALQPRASVSDYVDHIDYIVKRIGWEHVGIGTDFDHGAGIDGFDSAAEAANVTAELLRRGYDERQIAAIWSGNFLRVLRAAEAARR